MFSPMRRGGRLPVAVLALALAAWIVTAPSAFAHGGGGGGGGGHGGGGGGHSGGGHYGGGHYSSGYHHNGNGNFGGFFPGYFFGSGFYGYPGYGYGYAYPYYNSGYTYTYPTNTYDYSVYPAASPSQGRYLGIDEQPVADSAGPGMNVLRVYPGSPAEQAGLQPGDVILSANGYLTQQHGNIAWIISTVPPSGVLQMNVHTASAGAVHSLSARLP